MGLDGPGIGIGILGAIDGHIELDRGTWVGLDTYSLYIPTFCVYVLAAGFRTA